MQALKLEITGLVQGVGFRPFVYRIAVRNNLAGWVLNTNEGVTVTVQGTLPRLSGFKRMLREEPPTAARIDAIAEHSIPVKKIKGFSIRKSRMLSSDVTDISPDIATCDECLADMERQEHRLDYTFINCTHCGPRFSIIKSVPYDRKNTTMAGFEMCPHCAAEYNDITDRRFHAQPVACNNCGPEYALHTGGKTITEFHEILDRTVKLINRGEIIALKGIGGYQLVCDAFHEGAVTRLRKKKFREGKPFALMARDLEVIRRYCTMNEEEAQALLSWQRPVVLLKTKTGNIGKGKYRQIQGSVNPGLNTLGFLLPYMPFHHQLFSMLNTDVIVFTSGNLTEEPIICDDREALSKLSVVARAILTHDREIYSRCDDSVLMVVNGKLHTSRRSRGYVPGFIRVPYQTDGILALGAEMLNAFCIGKGSKAILSQYTGDMKNKAVRDFYIQAIGHFTRLFKSTPKVLVHDMHPGYFSTQYASELEQELDKEEGNVKVYSVQHHHAHIASAMANCGLDEKVIGICFDGTGYGTDGCMWGGEFLVCDLEGFERYSHLAYVPLPGGDRAVEEPWRTALSFLIMAFGEKALELPLNLNQSIPESKRRFVAEMIRKGVNCPLSSGAGRLFDAVSSLLGLCHYSRFEAEAPMKLEAIISPGCRKSYPLPAGNPIPSQILVQHVVEDFLSGESPGIISAKFHNTLISLIFDRAAEMSARTGIRKVVLSGGVFQNRYLLEGVGKKFAPSEMELIFSGEVPSNDGGIALGQLYIAAKKIQKNVSRGSGKGHKH
jgi:hydrogenase maturation protein HypF